MAVCLSHAARSAVQMMGRKRKIVNPLLRRNVWVGFRTDTLGRIYATDDLDHGVV
jgi:hypothetical protein